MAGIAKVSDSSPQTYTEADIAFVTTALTERARSLAELMQQPLWKVPGTFRSIRHGAARKR